MYAMTSAKLDRSKIWHLAAARRVSSAQNPAQNRIAILVFVLALDAKRYLFWRLSKSWIR